MLRRRSTSALVTVLIAAAAAAAGSASSAQGRPIAASPDAGAAAPTPYHWKITPTGSTDEFRGLAAVSRRVAWASGEAGTVLRTIDGGRTWRDVSPPAAAGLALRDIEAWNGHRAAVLSIGEGEDSRIYTTGNGGRTWQERFRNENPAAFYDCMAFADNGVGLALSDPVDGYFRLAISRDYGKTWRTRSTDGMPPARAGEFAFAASGTCLVSVRRQQFVFVTGGIEAPRVFTSRYNGRTWTVTKAPMRGGAAAGIYSADFRNLHRGVLVGGDYTAETNGRRASAYRNWVSDGWQPSDRFVRGYRSGVAFVPHTKRTVIAVGPTGSDVSQSGGRLWRHFDDDRYDGVHCAPGGACWASGTDGRIAVLQR